MPAATRVSPWIDTPLRCTLNVTPALVTVVAAAPLVDSIVTSLVTATDSA